MKLKKHALHLAVAAGMIGSTIAVAAPAAHAATPPPDTCATFLQGTIDPTGGPLPSGIIPLVPPTTTQTYGVFGHLLKGQDKEIINLNQAGTPGTAQTKASLGLTWSNAPYLTTAHGGTPPAGASTTMKLAWKTDKATGTVLFPTVQVAETDTAKEKGNIAKGTINGASGGDKLGVQTGNVQQGNPVVPLNTIDRVVVPQAATATDTYKLTMTFPNIPSAGPLAGVTLSSNTITVNATAAAVATAINTSPTWAGIVGPTATVVANTNPGDFTITFAGALQGQGLPILNAPTANQTGDLPTTILDDGSIWNSTRAGGVDPGITPISDLGNGIVTATGIMSSGVVGGALNPAAVPQTIGGLVNNGKNTGKTSFYQDTQATFIQYPVTVIQAIAPNLNISPGSQAAINILAGIVGLSPSVVGDDCGLGGLLAIFCVEDAAVIPATFAGLCGAVLS